VVDILEDLADPRVQSCALGGAELVVQRLPDQRMGESVPPRAVQLADDDLAGQGRAEGVEERRPVESERSLEDGEVEVAADHRGQREGLAAGRGQGDEAPSDRLAHALRDRKPRRARVAGSLECSLGNQKAHDLVHEEGIALVSR